ncbi:flavodoxin reductases (ferredoxin-NADPH reductases) family 1 [Vibrio astriarenae]|nr:flavodoxin reductases (ferredoxin-NADPH reductases) family 1 [Vibrio sp. C7]
MNALQKACENLDGGHLHFERFQPVEEEIELVNEAFDIILDSTGERLTVAHDQTILATLQANDIDVQVGCSNGMCGACMLDVLEGDIDHRDNVLDDEEKAENDRMCVCVSRANSDFLVLDI